MNSLQRQYFLAHGVMGCLVPFLAIYLKRNQGLTEGQIGFALGISGVSILFTPVLMTLLADTRFDPRRLASAIFSVSGFSLLALYFSHGFWLVLLLLCLHSLAYAGVMPLHDGIAFSIQRKTEQEGRVAIPYHRIRVWGTIGFIVPSLFLYFLLDSGRSTSVILLCGLTVSIFAALHVLFIPDPRLSVEEDMAATKLPTTMAVKLLFQPHMRVFCAAVFLVSLGYSAIASFYPLYLVQVIGAEEKWVGLIFCFGVVLEIGFLLSLGWLQTRFGLRKIVIFGAACFMCQNILLGLFPTIWVAILAQSVHGMVILSLFISPIMYLNRQSEDRFRNSIQGVYTMLVIGISRIIGIVGAGQVAQVNLRVLPFICAVLGLVAVFLFVFNFRDHEPASEPET